MSSTATSSHVKTEVKAEAKVEAGRVKTEVSQGAGDFDEPKLGENCVLDWCK